MNETASEAPPREISARIGNGHSPLMKIGGHIHLSPMERAVFNWLKHNRGGPREIAQDLGFKHASVRRVVQQLGDKGFVRSLGGTYEAALSSNPHILRNHSYDKDILHETVVSPKASVGTGTSRTLARLRHFLRMSGYWNSEYVSVQRMLDYLKLRKSGSVQSVLTICYILVAFCKNYAIAPDELAGFSREKVENLVQQYCDLVKERSLQRGPSSKRPNTVLACLKTFFACNGFNSKNGSELRVESYHQASRTRNTPEYVPTLGESLRMVERCGSKRDRAIILTLIAGLRNSSLRALDVGDILSELMKGIKNLLINVVPSLNNRIPGACKNNIPYYTFTAEIATQAIESMLKEREANFGSYSPEEPLFISSYNQISRGDCRLKRLSCRQLENIVHEAARAADILEWRHVHVHSLRKVFESVLRSPLADGSRMDHKDQEFFMGHLLPGSQDNYYDRSKIEKMRELCAKLVFLDRSYVQDVSLETTRKIAHLLGVDCVKVKAIKETVLGRPQSSKEEEELLEQEIKKARGGQNFEERYVQLTEIDQYNAEGWRYVAHLPDGRVVMKRRIPDL